MEVAVADDGSTRNAEDYVINYIPFDNFANLLEKISDGPTPKKIKRLDSYLKFFRTKFQELHNGTLDPKEANGDSIFCLIRLLLPHKDRERASYGIKSTVFARMFGKIMGLDPKSSDYKKLINFKNPDAVGSEAGSLSTIIQNIVESRSQASSGSEDPPMISELHHILDQLAKDKQDKDKDDPVTQEKQIKILQGFVRKIKPIEAKWLTRIILKHMDLGLTEASILKLVHVKAKDLLDTTGLEEVCMRLNDPATEVIGTGLCLFNFFKNMLCLRFDINEEDQNPTDVGPTTRSKRRKTKITLPPSPFSIETKWDGERFQIHYQRDPVTRRDTFKYFSRGGFDFTSSFSDTLTPRLRAQFPDDIKLESFILDGEMMAWNYARQCFTQKGQSIDVKRMMNNNPNHCPAFVAYDIVYLNGELLIDLPLKRRMEILNTVLIPKESIYYVSDKKEGNSMADVMAALDEAITNCEEGIIIKDIESTYHCGKRFACWLKLKPEYVHSCQIDDLDLLILGGYYSDSHRRGGVITSLLLGLIDNEDELYPITSVGCGKLKRLEMEELVSSLEPYFVKQEIPGIKYKGRKRPDLFIDPANSAIVQVKASEILYNKDYAIKYSLRFPRIIAVRRDKHWNEGMTVKEFHALRISSKGKLVKTSGAAARLRLNEPSTSTSGALVPVNPGNGYFDNIDQDFNFSSSDDDKEHGNSSRKSKRKLVESPVKSPLKGVLLKAKNATDQAKIPVVDKVELNIFGPRVFCVSSSFNWRPEMERKIKTYGGQIVRNPTSDLYCIIAENGTSRQVANQKLEGLYDIAKASWVDECIRAKAFKSFLPKDLYFAKKSTQALLSKTYDIYGDNHTQKSSLSQVKDLIQSVIQNHVIPEKKPTPSEIEALKRKVNEELFSNDNKMSKWSCFSTCKIAFREEPDLISKCSVEFYGGTVVAEEWESSVTHVILRSNYESTGSREKLNAAAFLMKPSWIDDCLERKECLNEVQYMVG